MKKLNLKVSAFLIVLMATLTVNGQVKPISIGQEINYTSNVLDEDVRLFIHLPQNYHAEREYPVIYLLDGEYFFTQLVSTVEFLSDCAYVKKELIPKFIVVAIATNDRNKDFTPTHAENQYGMPFTESGGAEKYLRFFKEELFPYVKKNYSVSNKKLLTGWSLGGLFTTYCYLNHSEVFDYYLAISPSLWWDNMVLTEQLKKVSNTKGLAKKKFTITIGELEKNPMALSVKESFVPVIKEVLSEDYFTFLEIKNESHSFSPFLSFYKGLQSIFYRWYIPDHLFDNDNMDELGRIVMEYAQEFGYTEDNLHGAAYHLYIVGISQSNYDEALKVAKFRAKKFPESVYAHYNLGEIYYRVGEKTKSLSSIKQALALLKTNPEKNADLIKKFENDVKEVTQELEGIK